jgi:hypothetical protein
VGKSRKFLRRRWRKRSIAKRAMEWLAAKADSQL